MNIYEHIDYTLLKPTATPKDIINLCDNAVAKGCAGPGTYVLAFLLYSGKAPGAYVLNFSQTFYELLPNFSKTLTH